MAFSEARLQFALAAGRAENDFISHDTIAAAAGACVGLIMADFLKTAGAESAETFKYWVGKSFAEGSGLEPYEEDGVSHAEVVSEPVAEN